MLKDNFGSFEWGGYNDLVILQD